MVVVNDRQSGDLAVVLKLEGELCVVEATDAKESWRLITEDRNRAIEYFDHPYVFKTKKSIVLQFDQPTEEDGA